MPSLPCGDLQENCELQHSNATAPKTICRYLRHPRHELAAEKGWNEGWALLARSNLRSQLEISWTKVPVHRNRTGQL